MKGKREVVQEDTGIEVSHEFLVIQGSIWREIVRTKDVQEAGGDGTKGGRREGMKTGNVKNCLLKRDSEMDLILEQTNKIQKEYFYLLCMFCSIPHCIRDSYYCKTEKYVYQDPTREAELEGDTCYGMYCKSCLT